MVAEALDRPDRFAVVVREVLPTLIKIARGRVGRDCDDAVQEAIVRIWQQLHKCDLSRPETARAWVIKVGVNAVNDANRKRSQTQQLTTDVQDTERTSGLDEDRCDDVLRAYLEDVRNTGEVSHASVGRKIGHSRSRMQTLFYESARKYRDGE